MPARSRDRAARTVNPIRVAPLLLVAAACVPTAEPESAAPAEVVQPVRATPAPVPTPHSPNTAAAPAPLFTFDGELTGRPDRGVYPPERWKPRSAKNRCRWTKTGGSLPPSTAMRTRPRPCGRRWPMAGPSPARSRLHRGPGHRTRERRTPRRWKLGIVQMRRQPELDAIWDARLRETGATGWRQDFIWPVKDAFRAASGRSVSTAANRAATTRASISRPGRGTPILPCRRRGGACGRGFQPRGQAADHRPRPGPEQRVPAFLASLRERGRAGPAGPAARPGRICTGA